MSDVVAVSPAAARFQFSISDVVAALLALAFPFGFSAALDPDFLAPSDRATLWGVTLGIGVLGFLFALIVRRNWSVRSTWVVPVILCAVWCLPLLFYSVSMNWWMLAVLCFYPPMSCGLVVAAHLKSMDIAGGLVAGASILTLGFIIAGAVYRDFQASHIAQRERIAAATCKKIAEAQEIYHRVDHDQDGRLEFAMDLGELYARKEPFTSIPYISEGLARADATRPAPQPYCGYYFRMLHAQSERSPGGAKSWLVNGELRLAHGVVAYPADYGQTGRFSFLISSTGTIYQYDYGVETQKKANETVFDPDTNWECCE